MNEKGKSKMNKKDIELQRSLEFLANGWEVSKLDIDYLHETISLIVESIRQQQIVRTHITFKEVLSFYVYQEEVAYSETLDATYRLNDRGKDDNILVSEIGFHRNGFGQVKIECIDSEQTAIDAITSKTNMYFQVNNKDHFFIECNAIEINDDVFEGLIQSSESLKITLD